MMIVVVIDIFPGESREAEHWGFKGCVSQQGRSLWYFLGPEDEDTEKGKKSGQIWKATRKRLMVRDDSCERRPCSVWAY